MSTDALDDFGLPLTILEQIAYSRAGKLPGFGAYEQLGDGLTDADFAERMAHLGQLHFEQFEHQREMHHFEWPVDFIDGKPVWGERQGARRYLPAAWRK